MSPAWTAVKVTRLQPANGKAKLSFTTFFPPPPPPPRWEYDESYCDAVKKMPPYDAGPRLLDVIDTAIFDYLIGNADRHHYESFQDDGGASMLILLDNAKRCVRDAPSHSLTHSR